MGLDMYLEARKSVSNWQVSDASDKTAFNTIIEAVGLSVEDIDPDFPVVGVELNVGYWRKANQIHRWFVDEVQDGEDDCRSYYVSREQLEDLFALCDEVSVIHSNAEELLPVASGMFFGSYEYDEWYFEQVEDTKKMLRKILDNPKLSGYDLYYRSSW